jgi:poly [ADP-ribose] polymerase 2/3/4
LAKVKSWKLGAAGAPSYPTDFEIVKKAVLQVTDIKTNRNKYYAIELHSAKSGAHKYRVFTHYGRTDDLETNPNAGQKENRFFNNLAEAEGNYASIYKQKTSKRKGYKEVSLASSKIGSQKARGTSSGDVDAKTLEKLNAKKGGKAKAKIKKSKLPMSIQGLVSYLYDEATNALTSQVNVKITAEGIETPLGVLTLGQIEKGEDYLEKAFKIFNGKKRNKASQLERLSGEFYSAIPHRIGRSRAAAKDAILDTLAEFEQKLELVQLMKDMLSVNGDEGVLFDSQIDSKYKALDCAIEAMDQKSGEFKELKDYILKSQIKHKRVKIKEIYKLKRSSGWKAFNNKMSNQRLLFHGSRIQNWVGILSRGILLPKIVVSMGVNRTDAGWLGNGIYFGDAACTSGFYTSAGRKGTRFMGIARVGLGKAKPYHKITYGISAPPKGFDSCHGIRRKSGLTSQFDDDEYVVYSSDQQRLEYLVEFKL